MSDAEEPPAPEVPEPPAPKPPAPLVKCPNCKRKINADKKFCPYCGRSPADLARSDSQRREMAEVTRESERSMRGLKGTITLYAMLLALNFVSVYVLPVHEPWGMLAAGTTIIVLCVYWLCTTKTLVAHRFLPGKLPVWSWPLLPLGSCVTFAIAAFDNHVVLWLIGVSDFFQSTRGVEGFLEAQTPLWVLIVSICVVPGIFEEIFFRGMIQSTLETVLSRKEALICQAVIFAIAHLNPLGFFTYLFIMGLWLGWLRNRSTSLLPGMLAHFTHNLIVVLVDRYHLLPW